MARTTFFSFSIILVLQAVLSGLSVACYPNCPIPPGTIKLPLPDRELIKGSLAVFHVQDGRTRFVGCIDNDGMVAHVYSKSNPCRSAATHAIYSPSDRSRFDQYRPLLLTYGSSQKFCGIKNNKFSCHSDMEEQGGLKDKYRNVDRLAPLSPESLAKRNRPTISFEGLNNNDFWIMTGPPPTANKRVPLIPYNLAGPYQESSGKFYKIYWFPS